MPEEMSDTNLEPDRVLSDKDRRQLAEDSELVPVFRQNKLEQEAKKHWDLFYKRNGDRFFKDRHWTDREFEELLTAEMGQIDDDGGSNHDCAARKNLMEIGCGAGNFFFPLLEKRVPFYIYACDFSDQAINLCKSNGKYDESLCKAFVADVTSERFVEQFRTAANSDRADIIDVASLVFVLSAIHPDKMQAVFENVYKILRPGGKSVLLFRDYGIYDYAMLRFSYSTGHKLQEQFYVRQDGTRAYYFTTEHLSSLAVTAGFQPLSVDYITRKTVNVKEGVDVPRIFVQAKFVKPSTSSNSDSNSNSDSGS